MSEEEIEEEVTDKKPSAKKTTTKKTTTKKTTTKKTAKEPERTQSQTIYIGKKNTISYVLVAVTILNKSDACSIQARGRQISKAVDVAEITRRKFLQDMVEVAKVEIGSEEITSDDPNMPAKTVSTVEIVLNKVS